MKGGAAMENNSTKTKPESNGDVPWWFGVLLVGTAYFFMMYLVNSLLSLGSS